MEGKTRNSSRRVHGTITSSTICSRTPSENNVPRLPYNSVQKPLVRVSVTHTLCNDNLIVVDSGSSSWSKDTGSSGCCGANMSNLCCIRGKSSGGKFDLLGVCLVEIGRASCRERV